MNYKFGIKDINFYLLYVLSISLFLGKTYNVVAGLIVILSLFDIIKNRAFFVFKDRFFIFMSVWCVYMLSSIFWATNKDKIPAGVATLFLWTLLYLATKMTLNSKDRLERFFKFQAYVVLFIAFNVILQFLVGFNIFGTQIIDQRTTDLLSQDRIYPFILPLYVGIFGAMLCIKERIKSHYILYSLALFALLISIPISGTRGPMVILAIFLPIIAWVSPYKKVAFSMLFVLLACVAVLVFNSKVLQDRISSMLNPFEDQKHLRVAIWKTSLETFKHNPILGVGFKNFRDRQFEYYKDEFESYEIDKSTNKIVHHSHSPWLDILSEQGIVGFFFMVSMFAFLFFNAYKKGAFMFISMFSVLYAFSFFNSTFVLSSSRWSFFMIFAVSIYSLLNAYHQMITQKEKV